MKNKMAIKSILYLMRIKAGHESYQIIIKCADGDDF